VTAAVDVVMVTTVPGALSSALAEGDGWLWLLAPGARPRSDALERLLAAIEPPGGPRAVIVVGMIEDPGGVPLASELPAGDPRDDEAVLRLAGARILPIRSTPLSHCLVHRGTLADHGLPDEHAYGPHAGREWSARVLRGAPGHLAATSVAVLERPAPARLRTLPATLRMTRTGAWTRGESLDALADLARVVRKRRG
jgi:hypothetical protein